MTDKWNLLSSDRFDSSNNAEHNVNIGVNNVLIEECGAKTHYKRPTDTLQFVVTDRRGRSGC